MLAMMPSTGGTQGARMNPLKPPQTKPGLMPPTMPPIRPADTSALALSPAKPMAPGTKPPIGNMGMRTSMGGPAESLGGPMPMTPPGNANSLAMNRIGGNYGTNNGNPRYGTDNAPAGGIRPPVSGGPGATNPAWMPQGGVSPFDASSGATGVGDFQRFSDAAYQRQADRLTPQFQEQERSFEQDMVNRGIAPGTPAYDNARANFEQARNDAFEGARTQADQLGAALQNQSFQQGAVNSQGLRELLLGQMGADASRFGATTSANASMNNARLGAQTAANQLGFQREQGDFSNLLSLLGIGQGNAGFNNGVIGQNNSANSGWLGQNANLLGLFQGGGSPGQIDVTGPYNNQYNAGLNQSQWQQQQNNANNQNYAQWASLLASMYGG